MLRKGQLRGERRPWGSRYVWDVSAEGVDEFLSEFGRLDGQRRSSRAVVEPEPEPESEPEPDAALDRGRTAGVPERGDSGQPLSSGPVPALDVPGGPDNEPAPDVRPILLRPRGRATVMVVVLGVPMLALHLAALTLPTALWFNELGQNDVFRRVLLAKLEFRVVVAVPVALFMGVNLAAVCRGTTLLPRRAVAVAVIAVSVVTGAMFSSAVASEWPTFVLWRHRQAFGAVDPMYGRDVGFFVFSLPFELLVSTLLLWLVAVTATVVAVVMAGRGRLSLRGRRASFDAQVHLAGLGAMGMLALTWRVYLERYTLELQQPSGGNSTSFAGASYVDVHVRMPGLTALAVLSLLLAVALLATPLVARRGRPTVRLTLGIPLALLIAGVGVAEVALPALVQRFVVEPSPLLREQPFLERSIAATRNGLGLNAVDVRPYSPTHTFTAADFGPSRERLRRVQIWDSSLLGDRMRQLVTDTPYFKPEDQSVDIESVDGRRQPTVVSARELDLAAVRDKAGSWTNDRLAYTHGLGLIRFSGTDTGPDREPRLLDSGLGIRQPRIYFGNLAGTSSDDEDAAATTRLSRAASFARSAWVLVHTRRAEVDTTSAVGTSPSTYHYTGPAGIPLSNGVRRAVFAMALHSKQLLLSHDITPSSRILLHRDVHDRLNTLAPFIHWDSSAIPLAESGRVVFVVDGYTTSSSYPYAARVHLGGSDVSYARPSVLATVDAFTGRVDMYLNDPDDPLIRAWAEAFPGLFRPADAMPPDLRTRLRYPPEFFDAQATAYQTFHTTDPSVFASDSDVWSRPIALSGGIEVAGGVDFDQSDEDNLRLIMQPAYTFGSPPSHGGPRLVLTTYYVPRRGQNLVATLSGWVDAEGRPRLAAMSLPRDPVTLGPAQISRLVFATPRVSNLLGLRNLEVRDIDKSSIDSVILGRPHLLFLSGGVMQIQSLYEGSRGPGAARLLGVTAYINGSAGLGPDIGSAVRQALNEPPALRVPHLREPVTVGQRIAIGFRVENARRETITISSADGRDRFRRRVVTGRGSITWRPTAAGVAHIQVRVLGLDETEVSHSTKVQVFGRPPAVRFLRSPQRAVVGKTIRIPFRILRGHHALATVSTRAGIVFSRRYSLPHGRGTFAWTPEAAGRVTILLRARGDQRQTATVSLRLRVHPAEGSSAPPAVELLHVPAHPTVGVPGSYAIRASGCDEAFARIRGEKQAPRVSRFPCPVRNGTFTWTPAVPGTYVLTTSARTTDGVTTSQKMQLTVAPEPGSSPSSSPSTSPSSSPSPRRFTSRPVAVGFVEPP